MSMALVFDTGLALLLVAIGGWVIAARDTFTAVIIYVVYGLLMSLAWVRLSAVDVALTEVAIGSGITGMLLLNAAARLATAQPEAIRPPFTLRVLAGVLCAMISAGLALLVTMPSSVAPSLAPIAMAHLAETGLGNPVAGVLFAYRALDTLLEKIVLVLGLLGVWSLAPDRLWGGTPIMRSYAQPNSILVFLAQVLPPIGIVFGIYMTWTGADYPGGAFQGGTVVAAMWLLVMMAGVLRAPAIGEVRVRLALVAGPMVFLTIGFAGFVLADGFLAYPAGYAKPLIVVIEFMLALSIGATLGMLAVGPPERIEQQ